MYNGRERHSAAVWSVLCALLAGIAVWLAATALWEARNWSDLKMEEVVYQLAALEGTGGHMVREYLLTAVLPGLAAAAIAGIFLFPLKGIKILFPLENARVLVPLKDVRILFSLQNTRILVPLENARVLVPLKNVRLRLPLRTVRTARAGALCSLCAVAGLLAYGWNLLDVGEYLANLNTPSEYIEHNYADPAQVELTFPERKRNLIYIWLESMESTFTDEEHGGAFPYNTIPELTRLAEENVSFTGTRGGVNGGRSLTGSTWTAGALFGQTTGLPLKIPIAENAMDSQKSFFPGVIGLGDILAGQGYRQALLIGSDADFGGRRQYFTQHGNYEIWDVLYSREEGEIPPDYNVWWGYEDEKLFQFARDHLTELAASDTPFNLSILTADTHFSDGYVCPLCSNEFGADQYSNVMACSSRQVADFVAWIQRQPFYENTTVILCGDHTTMDVDYCDNVSPDYPRRVYTTILNPAAEAADPERCREYTTYDMFPTTLAAMGVKIKGDRLGLGVNLFSRKSTLLERDGAELMEQELKRQSEFLNARSGIDPEMYRISEEFAATRVQLDVDFQEDTLVYTLRGLEEIEKDFTEIEVFAEHMNGELRTSLWFRPAQRQPDGSYVIDMPAWVLGDNPVFNVHFYGTTVGGRIKIDTGYVCDAASRTLVREPETENETGQ